MQKRVLLTVGRRWWLGLAAGCCVAALASMQLTAQTTTNYDRVEEDWEIVVNEPASNTNAPQLINTISPTWHNQGQYAIFEVNHITQPVYEQGGWQLQRWYGDIYRTARTSTPAAVLSTPGETITYTLALSVTSGVLKYELLNGQSQSWGAFGGPNENLSVASLYSNLNGYSTSLSVNNAKVGFASHRVARFALKEVRWYSGGSLVQTDSTVHEIPVLGSGT
jgi:hypothetical protein